MRWLFHLRQRLILFDAIRKYQRDCHRMNCHRRMEPMIATLDLQKKDAGPNTMKSQTNARTKKTILLLCK